MKHPPPLVVGLLLAAAVTVGLIVWIPRMGQTKTLSGYIEGEPLYLAAPVAGTVRVVHVARGQEVAAGQPLFVVDPTQVRAQYDQAAAEARAAEAQAQDARKGQRPLELAVFEANIAAAEARARDAHADLRRIQPLVRQGWYAPARLDDARSAADAADAQVRAARRQRDAATLGARQDQVRAADARVAQAQAAAAGAGAVASSCASLSAFGPSPWKVIRPEASITSSAVPRAISRPYEMYAISWQRSASSM